MKNDKKAELEETIEELEKYRARHTELITVYVPKGYNLNNISKQLESEKSTASNIKSSSTRKNVIDALETLIRQLKMIEQTPSNGLALFAGNVAEKEGQQDIQFWAVEPPAELSMRLYRCDQKFVLDPLKEMLQAKEIYGLVVIDRREATIGVLEGKNIKVIQHLTSGVPGKTEKGGQCLSPDSLVIKDNGEIIEIRDSHNPLFVISENFNREKTEPTPLTAKLENNKKLFKIITKYPRFEIKASEDHLFFVRTEKGIKEKSLAEIKEGEFLIAPRKINILGRLQEINFQNPHFKKVKEINIPKFLGKDLAKIFGYYLGDGSYESHRINLFEKKEDVAQHYKDLLEGIFGISCKLKFRRDKNYYQLRVHNEVLAQFFKSIFFIDNKTLNEIIPPIVLKSTDKILASFIKGFFDAEGCVSSSRVALGINNKKIAKQLQLSLLRLGIINSFLEYDNNRNPYSVNPRFAIEISCLDSLKKFYNLIGFTSLEKNNKLLKLIENHGSQNNINQLVVSGKDVSKIIRNSGADTVQFNCPMFFANKRQMSREVFKNKILDKIKDFDLKKRLSFFYNSNLILAKIKRIIPLSIEKTVDIETKNHNFIANGLVVHNSAARYSRIRDGLAKEFFRRVADTMKQAFFDMPKLKGIILGGPVPTKEDFMKEGQLVTKLKEMIIGMKDIGNTDPSGLNDLVEASHDLLAEQEIVHEKKLLDNFFEMLGKGKKAVYKKADVEKALNVGAVETLILDKKLSKKEISDLKGKAENIAAKIETVSEETEEGQQFKNLGGLGAILRFEI